MFKNMMQMIRDRSYHIDQQEQDKISRLKTEEEYDKYMNDCNFVLVHATHQQTNNPLIVLYHGLKNVKGNKNIIQNIQTKIEQYDSHIFIIMILNYEIQMTRMQKIRGNVQIFHISFFYRNIMQHELMAQYRLVPKSEYEPLFKKNGLTRQQLPIMFVTDPVSIYYHFKIGDIVEIKDQIEGLQPIIEYRCIMPSISKKLTSE